MTRSVNTLIAAATLAAAAVAAPAQAAQVLTNGNFSAGIAGWTSYTTANGTIAENPRTPNDPNLPQIATTVSFNTTGAGASDALFLNAGAFQSPYGTSQQGGGVFQTFTLAADGAASFYADIAATTRSNSIGIGLLSVFLDGVLMDSHNFGDVNNATVRSTLGFSTNLLAGDHTITLQATRLFGPARGVTSQYFDNVSLDVAAVPEPATWAMMILGFGVVGGAMRRRGAVARRRVNFAF